MTETIRSENMALSVILHLLACAEMSSASFYNHLVLTCYSSWALLRGNVIMQELSFWC